MTIINKDTWERIGTPILTLLKRIALSVTGHKFKFKGEFTAGVSFYGKTLKAKTFVIEKTYSLFGTDLTQLFKFRDNT